MSTKIDATTITSGQIFAAQDLDEMESASQEQKELFSFALSLGSLDLSISGASDKLRAIINSKFPVASMPKTNPALLALTCQEVVQEPVPEYVWEYPKSLKGLDVNGQNEYGTTKLMYAAKMGNLEEVESLLGQNADVWIETYPRKNKEGVLIEDAPTWTALTMIEKRVEDLTARNISTPELKKIITALKNAGAE